MQKNFELADPNTKILQDIFATNANSFFMRHTNAKMIAKPIAKNIFQKTKNAQNVMENFLSIKNWTIS